MENEVKLSRREARKQKLVARFTNPKDIKYHGPLSYRYLRIIAWLAFGVGMFLTFSNLADKLSVNILHPAIGQLANIFANLSTPLFIIAAFAYVLGNHKSYKNLLIIYAVAFVAIGAGFDILYLRYIQSFFIKIGGGDSLPVMEDFFKTKVDINVFADLLSFALFVFLINYKPKKYFQNKKIIFFRLLAILPLIYVAICYVLRVLEATDTVNISYYVFPFLTTKSPVVFLAFIAMAIWLKYREKTFLKLGLSKEQYKDFLKTNRNSLSFSISLSIITAIAALVDLFLMIIIISVYSPTFGDNLFAYNYLFSTYSIGQAFSMLLVIPFVLLFSYTKKHKQPSNADLYVVLGGVGFTVLMFVEGLYQLLTKF